MCPPTWDTRSTTPDVKSMQNLNRLDVLRCTTRRLWSSKNMFKGTCDTWQYRVRCSLVDHELANLRIFGNRSCQGSVDQPSWPSGVRGIHFVWVYASTQSILENETLPAKSLRLRSQDMYVFVIKLHGEKVRLWLKYAEYLKVTARTGWWCCLPEYHIYIWGMDDMTWGENPTICVVWLSTCTT